MLAIIKREINSFFSSSIGYLVIAIFLTINGIFLWVFTGSYNIFDNGFADLSAFFELAPWVMLFLIPSVTMRALSDEKKSGTLELLITKPISLKSIVLGKYFGSVILILIALIPTLLYVFTISELGNPPGNWDVGSTLGSYIGLLCLVFAFSAIGIFSSSLSSNQLAAFIIALFLCFVIYYAFDGIAAATTVVSLDNLGLKTHYDNISRGVLDTRDMIYFLSISIFFIAATIFNLRISHE